MLDGTPAEVVTLYRKLLTNDETAEAYRRSAQGDGGTYADAEGFAIASGNDLVRAFKQILTEERFEGGIVTEPDARDLLFTALEASSSDVLNVAASAQTAINRRAGIGLQAVSAEFDKGRVYGMVDSTKWGRPLDEVIHAFGEPVINFHQDAVAQTQQNNFFFQGQSGLSPRVVRTCVGNCCAWCQDLAGTHAYSSNMDTTVFRRHENCRCTCEYFPKQGDVGSKYKRVWR